MNKLVKIIEDGNARKENLEFNVGDSVKVHNLIKEGEKERVQMFEGVVTKKQGVGSRKTSNGVGVEKTFPFNSPMVVKVDVTRRGKARRAKLNYLRERAGKAAKVKENLTSEN